MRVRITRIVPGYTGGQTLRAGDVTELPDGLAASLVADRYAVPVAVEPDRSAPADRRETAARRPGRPRREG